MSNNTSSIDLTLVSTTAQTTVGRTIIVYPQGTAADQGEQEWIYIKNGEAATNFPVGTVVAKADGEDGYTNIRRVPVSGSAAGSAVRVAGVVQTAIPFGSFGWILRRGIGFVLADATGYAANSPLIPDASTAGCAQAGTETGVAFGWSVLVQTNAGATGKAILFCRG